VTEEVQYQVAKAVCCKLQKAGHQAYFVGGATRDLVLHVDRPLGEIDIATSARPDDVRSLFPGTEFVGKAFGVCLVKMSSSSGAVQCFEVATFRKEGGYSDRRRPDYVEQGTLEDDSRRRDFTMNAVYFDPVLEEMIDFHDGISHALAKKIRCVGVAEERFREDALRIVRLFRFAANCFMEIEQETLLGAVKSADGLIQLSRERIIQECVKVLPGCFVDFSSTMFASIDPSCFDKNLPREFASEQVRTSWLESVHVHYPLLALSVMISGTGKDAVKRFRDCVTAFEKWPGTRLDVRMMKAVCAVFDFVHERVKMSSGMQYLRWYKILELFRGASLSDVFFFLSAAAQIVDGDDVFLKAFLNHCAPHRDNLTEVVEWMKALVSQSVTAECRKSIAKTVSQSNANHQLIGVWVGTLEMAALCKCIGMRVPSCLDAEITADFIEGLSLEMATFVRDK
jgi:hypothetical protein